MIVSMKLVRRLVPLSEMARHVLEHLTDVDRLTLSQYKAALGDYNAKQKLWKNEIKQRELADLMRSDEYPGDTNRTECS